MGTRFARSIRSRLRGEEGIALVFAVVVMAVLAAGVTTVVVASSSSGRTAVRATADQQAYNYAEAGVNSAMAALHAAGANALDASLLPPPPPDPNARRDDYENGSVLWGGTLDPVTQRWSIVSVGSAHDHAAAAMPDRARTLSATSQVLPSLTQPLNNQAWNYIYAFQQGGPDACDVDISNNVEISAPLYVEGNLCLKNNAELTEVANDPPTPVSVVVKGKLQLSNNASVGVSGQPVSEVHVVGGCGSSLGNPHACNPAKPVRDAVYARVLDSTPPPISPPLPDWNGWYASASPGPNVPCDPATAVNAPIFDVDHLLDLNGNGDAPTLNLTPGWSYTCRTAYGELSWDAGSKTLTVRGVIYVDGNVTVANGAVNEYRGQATLYATGTFTTTNNTMMCGKRNAAGNDCDFDAAQGWNPNTEMLIVVAHGDDGSGASVRLANNTRWEGGVYCQNAMNLSNNAVVEGPMIVGRIAFSNNLIAKPFPLITTVPLGAPGNPNVYADAQPPQITG